MKEILRKELIKERDSIENKKEKSYIIFLKLQSLDIWKKTKIIHTYVSFRSEVDTRFIIYYSLINGKKVLCPIIKGENLLFGEIKSLNDLKVGSYGILEPQEPIDLDPEDIDIIIVPGIAFDLRGFRLGYGKGFYDRFLKDLKNPTKIGLIYNELIRDSLPTDDKDVRVDIVISEKRIIYTKSY
ncbi:MAG: 5-formyltetrahydrofolate cyclo-ligase [Dictyoglomaceae bacterium]